MDLGPVERHPRDDPGRAVALDSQGRRRHALRSAASRTPDLVAETDAARPLDLAVHAEVDVLAVAQPAVGDDRSERVEVAGARVGILGRDRAARDLLADEQDRLAELDPAADPGVLLVRLAAGELDEHPEPAPVDRAAAQVLAEQVERAVGDQRRGVLLARPARPGRPDEVHAPAGERLERLGPRAVHEVPEHAPAVHRGDDRLGRADVVLEDRAIRERHAQVRPVGIDVRRHLDQPPGEQPVDQPAGVVDQVEAAVLADALLGQLDLGGVLEGEPLDRRDGESADSRHRRDATSGTRRIACPGWGHGAPPRCPSRGRGACPADR